ncbi:TIGR04222 domain-containing membrane protein [Sphingomonas sp.]|uniref:TIGR04222 domain-containing membrane protein n=1 Tax=Sphingomonas sp. TaxID=28214 RepID=UPI001AFDC8E8|nr:TIGR04222 domain-containing membrane protein [Sphingomonas sp.]MBO9712917.1 TIGR04222 domain-containing membrane protein [Sphingomonas sp.]
MSLGPFDLSGPSFLFLYAILFAVAILLGILIPAWLRPEGNARPVKDPELLAYLAGGATRFSDSVVSRLLSSDALGLGGGRKFVVGSRTAWKTDAERKVLGLPQPRLSEIDRELRPHGREAEKQLVGAGLLMDSATVAQMRFWQVTPYLLLLGFGAIKLEVGLSRGKPVAFLVLLMVATGVFALVRLIVVDRRTRGGREILATERKRGDRLRRAPATDEAGLAVALFGTGVLAGSDMGGYHAMRASSGGDGGSGGGDGGGGCGGGGGGGGGGCGGCGGS